jgi:hypothetical protein
MNDDLQHIRAQVAELIARAGVPKERLDIRPEWGRRKYRGKDQIVVGYSWCKGYGRTARVYDTVLGWGPTLDAAFDRAEQRAAVTVSEVK